MFLFSITQYSMRLFDYEDLIKIKKKRDEATPLKHAEDNLKVKYTWEKQPQYFKGCN